MNKYLIVGLGNIGLEYAHTRHNIGFDVVDFFAQKKEIDWHTDKLATVATCKIKGKQVILIKPSTYMNLSGKAVKYWMDKEKIEKEHIFVIVDELALPLEKFRVRGSGSDAGHNGLKDIQYMLQSNEYPRLRFGIGNQFPKGQQVNFVLGRWSEAEKPIIQQKIEIASLIIEKFVLEGLTSTMNYSNSINITI
jgi:peptidyl-tRNA hydrolase, PTH1 family